MLASNRNQQGLFDHDFTVQMQDFLAGQGDASQQIRQGILEAADPSTQLRMYHGASVEPVTYSVQALKNNPQLRAAGPLEPQQAEIMSALFEQNVQATVNRELKKGEVPSWALLQRGMRAASGGDLPQVQQRAEALRRHLANLKLSNEQQAQIKNLEKKILKQKADFDRQLDDNKEEDKKRRQKEKEERNRANGPSPRPQEPGFAGLLKQAQRYDLKIIAIMGMLEVLCLPIHTLLLGIKAGVQVSPQSPEEVGRFFTTWLSLVKNHIDTEFGFGDEGQPTSNQRQSDTDNAHIQNQMQQKPPSPKPV